jgi:alpha-L-fucosidase
MLYVGGQLTPQQRDALWQASQSKFDSPRHDWLKRVTAGGLAGPFRPEWTSLKDYRSPKWYDEARFGIFIHWGVYSAPAFGDDPSTWAKLFREAGARYVVPAAEHHDGFAMYDSQLSDWTAVKMGPRRDVLGELRSAIRAEGLHFGLSSHGAEQDWTDASQDWFDDWLARMAELVTRYEPDLVYFDWWVGHPTFRNTVPKFLAYYYNQGATRAGVVVDYKPHGYIENDTYKTPALIIHMLTDAVSKNGNLMLNIGPCADGRIPDEVRTTLCEIGEWLRVNGEAIYASKPWLRFGEGPTEVAGGTFQETTTRPYTAEDFRFTMREGYLYAIQLGWPEGGGALIRSISPRMTVSQVRLLATGKIVPFTQSADGLHLMVPKTQPGAHAWVYRIEMN